MIPIKKEPEAHTARFHEREHCCFCCAPTVFWTKLAKRTPGAQVACCETCAKKHKASEVPSKRAWFADERKKHPRPSKDSAPRTPTEASAIQDVAEVERLRAEVEEWKAKAAAARDGALEEAKRAAMCGALSEHSDEIRAIEALKSAPAEPVFTAAQVRDAADGVASDASRNARRWGADDVPRQSHENGREVGAYDVVTRLGIKR